VFLNGYIQSCQGNDFASTFATADQVLAAAGRASVFFDNCSVRQAGTVPPIEELGAAFGRYLDALRYADGQPVPQVDIIAHSMGGLIVRSYLSGKQAGGEFRPPENTRIRRIVFLGTPHFGTPVATLANDVQTQQLLPGSNFLWELNTWNQGIDDLRGVPSLNVAGDAGGGPLASLGRLPVRFHDGVVLLSSAASWAPVRVLRFCHTTGQAELGCENWEGFLPRMTGASHESARIATSFLAGTDAWMTVGRAPAESNLNNQAGLWFRMFDNNGNPVPLATAEAVQPSQTLEVRNGLTAWTARIAAGDVTARLNGGPNTILSAPAGVTTTAAVKPGPLVGAAVPTFAVVSPRAVAPGAFISIYGRDLAAAAVEAGAQPYPTTLGGVEVRIGNESLPLNYVGPTQINAIMPESVTGLQTLTVINSAGRHSVRVLIERTAPAAHAVAANALTGARVTAEAPIREGEYLSVYLTGLGQTERRADGLDWAREVPTVQIGNGNCALLYAGRSPGYAGLDQINCQVPANLNCTNCTLSVRTGGKLSNSFQVPVRP
jgi:uncharacterized protein (TIGR03437 family)